MDFVPKELKELVDFTEFIMNKLPKTQIPDIVSRIEAAFNSNLIQSRDIFHLFRSAEQGTPRLVPVLSKTLMLLLRKPYFVEDEQPYSFLRARTFSETKTLESKVKKQLNIYYEKEEEEEEEEDWFEEEEDACLFGKLIKFDEYQDCPPGVPLYRFDEDDIDYYRSIPPTYNIDIYLFADFYTATRRNAVKIYNFLMEQETLDLIHMAIGSVKLKYALYSGNEKFIQDYLKHCTPVPKDMKYLFKAGNEKLIDYFHDKYKLPYLPIYAIRYHRFALFFKYRKKVEDEINTKSVNYTEEGRSLFFKLNKKTAIYNEALKAGIMPFAEYLYKMYNLERSGVPKPVYVDTEMEEFKRHFEAARASRFDDVLD